MRTNSRTLLVLIVFTALSMPASRADEGTPESQTTQKGAVYTRVAAEDGNAFGEGWRDPRGVVWREVLKDAEGIVEATQKEAVDLCAGLGARLPTREEYQGLRVDFGFSQPNHYQMQILKDLDGLFWTATFRPDRADVPYYFAGKSGYFLSDLVNSAGPAADELYRVRCVK